MKANSYEMIIWWSAEDTAYVVDVPELPGCMAHGATRQEAIKNAEDAMPDNCANQNSPPDLENERTFRLLNLCFHAAE